MAGAELEAGDCCDAGQEVGRIDELDAGEVLDVERGEEVLCRCSRAAIADSRVEPVVLAVLDGLMSGAAVVGIPDPQVG